MPEPIDFSLPTDDGQTFEYNAEIRAAKNVALFFYRGHW